MESLQPQLPENIFITVLLPAIVSRLNFQHIWWKNRMVGETGTAGRNNWVITGHLPVYLRQMGIFNFVDHIEVL